MNLAELRDAQALAGVPAEWVDGLVADHLRRVAADRAADARRAQDAPTVAIPVRVLAARALAERLHAVTVPPPPLHTAQEA